MSLDRITSDPGICQGQPVIRGTRIQVGVLVRMIAAGMSVDEVAAAYPELKTPDARQALEFAAWLASERTLPLAN